MLAHGVIGQVGQVGKFGVVGILNTVLDFAIFNLLTGSRIKMARIPANMCSTTVAMIFSFFANRDAVFTAGSGNPLSQAVLFFAATGFGLYVLQSGVLYVMLKRWQWPRRLAGALVQISHIKRRVSADFILKNGAKGCGTLVSLTWNFFLYKYVVFR